MNFFSWIFMEVFLDLDCNSMEDLSRKGEDRPMPAVNSFMPLYSSDDSQVIIQEN
jgi:hypothetical protein